MPDWPTVNAVAFHGNFRIVIRFVNNTKPGEHFYFYHSKGDPRSKPQDFKTVQTSTGPAVFQRLFSRDHKTYQYVQKKYWGFFLPKPEQDWYWIEYQYLESKYWDLPDLDYPEEGPIDAAALAEDKQAIWGSRIPEEPSTSPVSQTLRGGTFKTPESQRGGVTAAGDSEDEIIVVEEPPKARGNRVRFANDESSSDDSPNTALARLFPSSQKRRVSPLADIIKILPAGSASTTDQQQSSGTGLLLLPSCSSSSSDRHSLLNKPITSNFDQSSLISSLSSITRPTSLLVNVGAINKTFTVTVTPTGLTPDLEAVPKSITMGDRVNKLQEQLKSFGYDPKSSQHPLRKSPVDDARGGASATTPDDDNVRALGKIEGNMNNLETAIKRNLELLSDGRPPITLNGPKVQSPMPGVVLDQQLLDELNNIAYAAAIKCSKALINAQTKQFERLQKEKDEILEGWQPDEDDEESIRRIANARTKKFSAPTKKPVDGGIKCFVKGEHCLEPNPELERLHATGLRTSGAKPNQQPPGRTRSSSRRRPRSPSESPDQKETRSRKQSRSRNRSSSRNRNSRRGDDDDRQGNGQRRYFQSKKK